jgi:hypothetical protein
MILSYNIGGEALTDYKRHLNVKDPIDKLVMKLAKEGELKVGFVEIATQ